MMTSTRHDAGVPPANRAPRLLFWALLGPGLIAASAGNDAGGVLTYASAGAQFGYQTLFFMVVVTVFYVVVQEIVARLSVFTGKGLAALIREQFSLRLTAFAILAFAVGNLGLMVTEFGGIRGGLRPFWGFALHLCSHRSDRDLVACGSRVVPLRRAALPTHDAGLCDLPDCGDTRTPQLAPGDRRHGAASLRVPSGFLLLGVALIGTTITPYIQLYEAGAVVDKGVRPSEYRYQRIDAIGGAVISDLVSMTIIITTAAAIGGTGALTSAPQAAHALEPVAGQAAETLFGVGLLGASALAAAVVPLSTSYAIAEAVGAERSVSNSFRRAPLFLGVFTFQILFGALVVLVPGNLVSLIINTQVLEGVITPITLLFILILANRSSLLGRAERTTARWLGAITVVSVGGFAAFLVLQTVLGWFGGP